MPIEIRTAAHDSPEYWQIVDLRRRVLRTPLGLDFPAERLQEEHGDIHIAAWDGTTVLGTVMLHPPQEDGHPHLGQMAVAPEAQGQGIGAKLMRELERIAAAQGWSEIVLESRQTAVPFYERLGYAGEGDTYIHAGTGLAHRTMRKLLSTASA